MAEKWPPKTAQMKKSKTLATPRYRINISFIGPSLQTKYFALKFIGVVTGALSGAYRRYVSMGDSLWRTRASEGTRTREKVESTRDEGERRDGRFTEDKAAADIPGKA
jgi:hypothetical protein